MQLRITKLVAGALALGALTLGSCKKDEVRATLTPSNSITLASSTNSVVLQQANSTQTAATFTWSPIKSFTWNNASNTEQPAVAYNFEFDKKGNNFAKPAVISAGNGPASVVTVQALNEVLTSDLGLKEGVATDLEVRLAANYYTNGAVYSPTLPLTVTPYKYVCNPPAGSNKWGIVGSAAIDWNTDAPMRYNCTTNTFDITRALNVGEFKFRADGGWTLNYGNSSSSSTATGGALVQGSNDNIKITTAGTYTIKLDLNAMTYSITQ
jgi:hypothetical protein